MSQVIMLLLFPIGLYFYFFVERKARPAYEKVFTDFEAKTKADDRLNNSEKINRYKEMLYKNGYTIKKEKDNKITGEKKIFSMSLFAMSVGVYYVGAVIYLLYFYYFQTPDKIVFSINEANKD